MRKNEGAAVWLWVLYTRIVNGSKWSEQSRRGRARWLADICSDACRRRLGEIGVSREIEREREKREEGWEWGFHEKEKVGVSNMIGK